MRECPSIRQGRLRERTFTRLLLKGMMWATAAVASWGWTVIQVGTLEWQFLTKEDAAERP